MKMKLLLESANPENLKNAIIKRIKEGQQETWNILEHDKIQYLRHTGNVGNKGVVKLSVNIFKNSLVAEIVKFEGIEDNLGDFEGYILGRFCEIIFVNFRDEFTSIKKG